MNAFLSTSNDLIFRSVVRRTCPLSFASPAAGMYGLGSSTNGIRICPSAPNVYADTKSELCASRRVERSGLSYICVFISRCSQHSALYLCYSNVYVTQQLIHAIPQGWSIFRGCRDSQGRHHSSHRKITATVGKFN